MKKKEAASSFEMLLPVWGWDSVVSVATSYGLDSSELESPKGRDFLHLSIPAQPFVL